MSVWGAMQSASTNLLARSKVFLLNLRLQYDRHLFKIEHCHSSHPKILDFVKIDHSPISAR